MKKLKDEKNYKWMSTLGDFEKVRERHETGKQRNEDETRDEGDESEENERVTMADREKNGSGSGS